MTAAEGDRRQPEPQPERVILGTLDVTNPDRTYIATDEMVDSIAHALGVRRFYSNQDHVAPSWSIDIGTETNFCEVAIQTFEKTTHRQRVIIPAHDHVRIYRSDRPPGKGHIGTADTITGITSVELEGDMVTFVQNIDAWELRYSIGKDLLPQIIFKAKGRPVIRTIGDFGFQLKTTGQTRPVLK